MIDPELLYNLRHYFTPKIESGKTLPNKREVADKTPFILETASGKDLYVMIGGEWVLFSGGGGAAENGLPAGGSINQVLKKLSAVDYDAAWDDETAANGLPEGGTTNQVLAKASNSNYDAEWVDPSGGSASQGSIGEYIFFYPGLLATTPSPASYILVANQGSTYLWQYYNTGTSAWVNLSGTNNQQTYLFAHNNAAFSGDILKVRCLIDGEIYNEITMLKFHSPTIPSGGADGQILAKASNTDFDTEWITLPESGIFADLLSMLSNFDFCLLEIEPVLEVV